MPTNQLYTIALYTIQAPETPSVLLRYWRDKVEVTDAVEVEVTR
jgi:hypothetical protein